MEYMTRVRCEVGMILFPPTKKLVDIHLKGFFIEKVNEAISILHQPTLKPILKLERAKYVCDGKASQAIACTKLSCAGLGNRAPRRGHTRVKFCPLCPRMSTLLNEEHVIINCPGVKDMRSELGLTTLFNLGKLEGMKDEDMFNRFVSGEDWDGNLVDLTTYLSRGDTLSEMYKDWLAKW